MRRKSEQSKDINEILDEVVRNLNEVMKNLDMDLRLKKTTKKTKRKKKN